VTDFRAFLPPAFFYRESVPSLLTQIPRVVGALTFALQGVSLRIRSVEPFFSPTLFFRELGVSMLQILHRSPLVETVKSSVVTSDLSPRELIDLPSVWRIKALFFCS